MPAVQLRTRTFEASRSPRSSPAEGIDVERARRDTAGCVEDRRCFNGAGSALPPKCVVEAQIAYLRAEERLGGYTAATELAGQLDAFYPAAAKLLGCDASEVAFVESATRAWTLLFHSVRFSAGDRVLTSASDYGSNFVSYLLAKERQGVEVVIVPDDEFGQVDLGELRKEAAHPRARLISINHVPTCGGLIQPAAQIGKIAKEFGVLYLLDACQSVGQLHVDVRDIGCDMLSATGRKYLRGPRGTGLLYVRDGVLSRLEPCMLDQEGAQLCSESELRLRSDARVFEQYECNFAGKVGLAVAIEYALAWGMPSIERRVRELAAMLRESVGAIAGIEVTDVGRELCGIVTFQARDLPSAQLRAALNDRGFDLGLSVAAGGAPRVWFDRRGISAVVRASPHYYNTTAEVDALATEVADVVAGR